MRAKLLESDINKNGESKDDFEKYIPPTPTPPSTQNGIHKNLAARGVFHFPAL